MSTTNTDTWLAVEPRSVRKAPWSSLGRIYEGIVLRKDGSRTVEVRPCGHQHINPLPARKCSEALARKLNKAEGAA